MQLNELSRPGTREQAELTLIKGGYERVAGGTYAVVYGKPGANTVLKLLHKKDVAYIAFVNLAMKHQNNPHFPRFSGKLIRLNDDYRAVRMERLVAGKGAEDNHRSFVAYALDLYIARKGNFNSMMPNYVEAIRQAFLDNPELQDACDLIVTNLGQFVNDLHPGNVMFRGPTVVITDPVAPHSWQQDVAVREDVQPQALSPEDEAKFAPYKWLTPEDRDFYIRLSGGVDQAVERIEKERRKGIIYRAQDRAVQKVKEVVPALVHSNRPVSYQVACAIIAYDEDLFNMVCGWTSNADYAEERPEIAARFLSVLKRISPPRTKRLYRGQMPFSPHSANKRGFHSWSENRKTAEDFAERHGKVLEINRPIQGVSLSDIITWRMRLTDESHYPGPQAEWFVVDQPEQYERD